MKKITKIFANVTTGRVATQRHLVKMLSLLLVVMSVLMIVPTDNISAKTQTEKSSLNYTYKELDTVNTTKFKLKVNVSGFKASKATFKSSNKKVAKVSKKGVVTAKKEGTAIITVTYKKKTYQCGIVVFDGKGGMYDLRKEAKNVRDNCSLIALNFREFVNGAGYFDNEGEEDYTFMNTDFTHLYRCYEVRKNEESYCRSNPYCGAGSTHAFIDFEQTKQNLLATGLFEEIPNANQYNSLTCVKPIKPFTYDGVTYDYIADYTGKDGKTYYISSFTGMIYDTFLPEGSSNLAYPCHFRSLTGKLFGAVDYSKYEKNGELAFSFLSTTYLFERTNGNNETRYMEEVGYSHKLDNNFQRFIGIVNLDKWYYNSKNSNFSPDAPEDVK